MIEREFAEQLEVDAARLKEIGDTELALDVKWITTFLSADKKKSYCLYEAADVDLLRLHAERLGFPLDVITEVDELKR
ncbi:MAG TPA: DUF4242 domain-containing protein [Acidimicrobiales bacterium]|nr:DUF4242 domain-containing protein [Acidimicrobiales bacterium]